MSKMEINFVKLGVKSKIFLQKQKVTQVNLNTKLSINNRPLPKLVLSRHAPMSHVW